MKYEKYLQIFAILALVGIFTEADSVRTGFFEVCSQISKSCIQFPDILGSQLFAGSFAALLISTILIALRYSIFRTWLWFGGWYVPLALMILAFYPEPRGMNFSPSVEQMTFYVTSIFIWTSLTIIIVSIIRNSFKKIQNVN